MTTPAGWYDDGSGRQRWWDGEQWTEHFAPDVEALDEADAEVGPEADFSAGDVPAATEDAVESDAAWADAAASTEAPTDDASSAPAPDAVPAETPTEAPAAVEEPAAPWSAESAAESPALSDPTPPALPSDPTPPALPSEPAQQDWSSPPPPPPSESAESATPAASDQGGLESSPPAVPSPAAPAFAAPTGYPGGAAAPMYAPVAPAYAPAAPSYGPGGPGYPGAGAGAYPMAGYGAVPEGPAPMSVLGLIGAGAAALGFIFAFIQVLWAFSWILLGAGLIISLISLFRNGRKWPGITGMIVAVIGFILAVVMGILFFIAGVASNFDDFPTTSPYGSESDDPSTTPVNPEDIEGAVMTPVIDLALGDCLPYVESGDDIPYEVPVVPCDLPHTEEVYLVYDIASDEYPGEDEVIAQADERCLAEFETFVGIAYADSEYDFYYYYPTSSTWTSQNDRAITCIVYSYDDVTGTLQGAGR